MIRLEAERRVDFQPPPAFQPERDDLFGLRDPLPTLGGKVASPRTIGPSTEHRPVAIGAEVVRLPGQPAQVLAGGPPVGLQNLVNGYLMQPEAAGQLGPVKTFAAAAHDPAVTRQSALFARREYVFDDHGLAPAGVVHPPTTGCTNLDLDTDSCIPRAMAVARI